MPHGAHRPGLVRPPAGLHSPHAARGSPTWAARRSAPAPPSAKDLVAFTVEDAQSDRSGRQFDIRSGDDCARRIQKPDLTLARRLGLLALVARRDQLFQAR